MFIATYKVRHKKCILQIMQERKWEMQEEIKVLPLRSEKFIRISCIGKLLYLILLKPEGFMQ